MSSVRNTTKPAAEWLAGGIPITAMMNMEKRNGKMKPVIQKALVKLDGGPFKFFAANREKWAIETDYVYPIQSSTSVPPMSATSQARLSSSSRNNKRLSAT